MSDLARVPPPHADLEFARNRSTGIVHILCHVPQRGDPGYAPPQPCASFAEGLAAMFTTPHRMLCGFKMLVGDWRGCTGAWTAGDAFPDDALCARCVRALGDQQWRAFHADARAGTPCEHVPGSPSGLGGQS